MIKLDKFEIVFVKRVVFTDWHGTVLKVFEIGDRTMANNTDLPYYNTSWGGIYFDEAARGE